MDKGEVYNESKEGDFLLIKLVYNSFGGVDLAVVNEDGSVKQNGGNVLQISEQGWLLGDFDIPQAVLG